MREIRGIGIRARALFGGLAALLIFAPPALAEEAIEEIVVTGSFLKRTAQDSPAPLSVVSSADIEDLGIADVAELVQTLPWQSGSQARATTFSGEGADGRNSFNLRGLGHGSTLILVDGKRTVASWFNPRGNASVNVNALVPTLAIERVEIVKDGASALYGSDAIAGVVNFITKRDFEGFDINYQFTTDDETGRGDAHQAEIMFGVQGDRGGIVASASVLNRDEITIGDRYDRFGGSSVSSTGQPGRITPIAGSVIQWATDGPGYSAGDVLAPGLFPRDASGTNFGQADVNCEDAAAVEEGGPLGPVFGNLICAYDFGSFFAMQADESLRKINVSGDYRFTDNFEAYFQFASNESEFDRKNSLNPNALNLTIPTNHLGLIEDARRRNIVPVPVINRTRLVGQTASSLDRPVDTFTDTGRLDQRMMVGGTYDFVVGDREWTIDASYTATEHDSATSQVQDTLSTHMELAISGFGGPECDPTDPTAVAGEGNAAYAASGGDFNAGQCYFFNPFGNSNFTEGGGQQTDLTLRNPIELYQWLLGRITNDSQFRQRVIDVVASGDVVTTDWGPIGAAIGFQRRRDTADVVFDAAANTNNLDFAFGAGDWDGALTTTAAFIEVGIPITNIATLNIAGRYEDFDELNTDTFDPKINLLVQPNDWLSIRASWGESFRVPSLQQLFGTITTVANQTDFGGDSAFRPSISVGNPALSPERSENWSIGFTFNRWGINVDLDYFDYKYTDIITREASRTILQDDNEALEAAILAAGGDLADPQALIDAVNSGAGNRRQVVRNGQGAFLRILPDFVNANSADISGLDLNASYTFDTGIGQFRVGAQMAWVNDYEVAVPDGAGGETVFDAVGQYNHRNPVARPLPEFKINGTVNWSWQNHRAFLLVQHTDEIDYGFDLATDPGEGAARFWNATVTLAHGAETAAEFFTRDIDSFTTVDLQYNYNFGERGFLADSNVTLGMKNLFNEEPPWAPVNTGFEATLHDPRGRLFFVRLGASL
ncbi:MAG: TonB-dependent receptor [Pseudomonadota bacterium]